MRDGLPDKTSRDKVWEDVGGDDSIGGGEDADAFEKRVWEAVAREDEEAMREKREKMGGAAKKRKIGR